MDAHETQTRLANWLLDALEHGDVPTLEFEEAAILPLELWAGARPRAEAYLHDWRRWKTEDDPEPLRRRRALARVAHVRAGRSLADLPEPPPILELVT